MTIGSPHIYFSVVCQCNWMIITTCHVYYKIFRKRIDFFWFRIIINRIISLILNAVSKLSRLVFSPGINWTSVCWYQNMFIWTANFDYSGFVKFANLHLNIYKFFLFINLALIYNFICNLESLLQYFFWFLTSFVVCWNKLIVKLI